MHRQPLFYVNAMVESDMGGVAFGDRRKSVDFRPFVCINVQIVEGPLGELVLQSHDGGDVRAVEM